MRILVVGGTGTLGQALIERYYDEAEHEIICISRDELKQSELKAKFPGVRCILGDIRGTLPAIPHVDILYHVAALKQIDVLEENIEEAIQTNVCGTINLAKWAIEHGVKKYAFASTDKAVYPINVYGNTKAISEKYLRNLNKTQAVTKFKVFRWGNVLGSRGSVLPMFKNSLLEERVAYITHQDMTRFWIKLEDAVSFMMSRTESDDCQSLHLPPMKASFVRDLVYALAKKLNVDEYKIEIVGLRLGEKLHEWIDDERNSLGSPHYSGEELSQLLEGVV